MDVSGRIVIPKALRDSARLVPGQPLKIEVHDGAITIEPEPLALTLETGELPCRLSHGQVRASERRHRPTNVGFHPQPIGRYDSASVLDLARRHFSERRRC